MFRRIRPKWVGVWLLCGIILPAFVSYKIQQEASTDHGVVVTKGSGSWYEYSIQSALNRLTKKETETQEISCYYWSPKPATYLVVFKGRRVCDLKVNSLKVLHKDERLISAGMVDIPAGLSFLQILIQPDNRELREPVIVLWSENFHGAREIPAAQSYTQAIPNDRILTERIGRILGIVARINVLLIPLWIILRLGKFPLFFWKQDRSQNILAAIALLAMIFLRFSGMLYQVDEGLHPDEKLYGGMIQQVRQGELAPTQFWYTTGYFYITSAAQKLAEWVTGTGLTQNLIQRCVSAICSSLTCILVFSIARSFLSFPAAFVAMLLFGFAFMPVELAHYGIVEPTLVFFFVLSFSALVALVDQPSLKGFAKAGLLAGAAIAVKQTAALIGLPFFITWIYLLKQKSISRGGIAELLTWCGCAFAGFFALSPATILDLGKFYQYQRLQTRSLGGEAATHLFFVDHQHFGELAWRGLYSGMGYAIVIAAILGTFLIWKKSRIAGWLVVPALISYLILISKITAVPEHYVLILCPFVALLAAVSVDSIPDVKGVHRVWIIAGAALVLIAFNCSNLFTLERLLHGTDTRKKAVEWCYQNIPAGSRIDYDLFGPRFLIPMFETNKPRLFERPPIEHYLAARKPDYFVQDSLTTNIFLKAPEKFFANERRWFEFFNHHATLSKEFTGEEFRLLNPNIRIYKLP